MLTKMLLHLKRLGMVLLLEEFDVVDDQFYLTGQTETKKTCQ